VTAKSAEVPFRLIAFNQRVFPSPHEPVTVDNQETARHLTKFNVIAAGYLSGVFAEPPAQGSIQRLASVHDPPMPVEGINAFLLWSHIFRKRVGRARLKLLNQLMCERLVELEEELVSIAHSGRILS
jgi:hypothetical protein